MQEEHETNTSDGLLLIFALGGKVLAFYEIKTLVQLLQNTAGGFPEYSDTALREALNNHPDIITDNGNYFTCIADKLEKQALDYLQQPNHADLVSRLAHALPWDIAVDNIHPERLMRDVRNSLLIRSAPLHKQFMDTLKREFPRDFAIGTPYQFLADPDYLDFLSTLSPGLLSVCLHMLAPTLIRSFQPLQPLLKLALRQFPQLPDFARFQVVDLLIVSGCFQEADEMLSLITSTERSAVNIVMRRAWLDFVNGQHTTAIHKYHEALDIYKIQTFQNDYFITNISGIFFILALIKEGSQASLDNALMCTRIGAVNAPLYSDLHTLLHAYIDHLRGHDFPTELLNCEGGGFYAFVSCLVSFWLTNGAISDERLHDVQLLAARARQNGYCWLADEADELLARLSPDWMLRCASPANARQVVPLVDCVLVLPGWTRELNELDRNLEDFFYQQPMRTAWTVSFSASCPTNVELELYVQHLTKTDKWSKGHRLSLEKILRELRQDGNWPVYFTAQDIHACCMLLDLATPQDAFNSASLSTDDPRSTVARLEHYTHNDVLLSLIGHPLIYWADDSEQIPIRIVVEAPYVQISREGDGNIMLGIFPKVDGQSHLSAVRYEDNSLHIFSFKQIHRQIYDSLHGGVSIPEQAVERFSGSCQQLARLMRVKSDYGLETLTAQETRLEAPGIVMRIERKTSNLSVELLVQPFGADESLRRPGEGPQAILEVIDGRLVRKLRDLETEQRRIDDILALCPALSGFNQDGPYHWSVENEESAYQFMLQLQEITGLCTVLWKHDRKLALSRRIGFGDVRLNASQGTQWLEIDGEIKVDENLTLSFQKLLELVKQQKGNFIKADKDRIIVLTEEFRRSLDSFNHVGHADSSGRLLFNPLALPVLQHILDDYGELTLSPEWSEQVRKIDEARTLEVPDPVGLAEGTVLRDYQLEGYRWLTRLDHWGAGACLADDMGLGKTVQAIAFIQSKSAEGPALVVAPTSVCANWVDELARFAPTLKTVVFGQGNRDEMLKTMKPGMVMVSSYGLLQSCIASFHNTLWRVVVLDEAQAIKNYQAKRSQAALQLHAQFRLATTGTPIENNLGELWTLFQFITPGLFGSRQAFQDRFTTPSEREPSSDVMQRLSALIRPFLLRRKKDDVLRELPPKTEKPRHVYLSPEERAFYEAVRKNLLQELEERPLDNQAQQRIRILAAITKLRQAACNPLLIEAGTQVPSAKLEEFRTLIRQLTDCGHKTLVFSQFVRHLDIIRHCLDELHVSYEYLDGSTPAREREEAVKSFQEGNKDVFLISLRAGGLGLNLTRADNVIILDPWWNPAVEDQAADRAHRLGQERPVTIYRLIAHNTIEDKIIELHNQKKDLAVQLLDGADTAGAISAEELIKLLQDAKG